jgi:hypothetical protein
MLDTRKNLKVIHLFRDPRAIINSRIETKWFPSKTDEEVIENAKSLCNKMLYDFRKGQNVHKKYPDRFKFIYYEDLTSNMLSKSKILYNYIGMNVDETYFPEFMKHIVSKKTFVSKVERKKNSAYWWRKNLNWTIVKNMEIICKDVYTELGYKPMSSFQEYVNLSMPSTVVPNEYLIVR